MGLSEELLKSGEMLSDQVFVTFVPCLVMDHAVYAKSAAEIIR